MTTLHVTIPADLEEELTRLQPDLETIVLKAIRQFIGSTAPVATEHDLEMATAHDQTDEFLTPQELAYYLALP